MLRKTTLFICLVFCSVFAKADEGMWIPMLLEQLNESDMKANGMRMSAADIYSVNQSSLKDAIFHFDGGCTSAVVSQEGLIFTNHHCGFGSIQFHSSVENDYLRNGFWAKTKADELRNEGMTATRIVRMEDVTKGVMNGVTAGMEESKRQEIIAKNIAEISKKAIDGTHYEAKIRPFYYGNEYYMFVTEVFRDIRLVGAPPSAIGKYGGDTDNWMWPRHTGDFSVFRIYAGKDNKPSEYANDNVPYKPIHHLPVSLKGVKENDFTLVFGFPGRTYHELPSFGVKYATDVSNAKRIEMREASLAIIDKAMLESDEIRIKYAAKQSRISNAYKKWIGQNKGLKRNKALKVKRDFEKEFTSKTASNKEYSGLIEKFKAVYSESEKFSLARDMFVEIVYYGPEIIRFANRFESLVDNYHKLKEENKIDVTIEDLKKRTDRFFKDYSKDIDQKVFLSLFKLYLDNLDPSLRPDISREIITKYKGDYAKYAANLYKKSLFVNQEKVNALIASFNEKSIKKIQNDPGYLLMKQVFNAYYGIARPDYIKYSDEINRLMRTFIKAKKELFSKNTYWADANSTLRVTYGKVKGYEPMDGVKYKHYTTLKGVVDKYQKGHRDFDLPDKLIELYEKKDFGQYAQNGEMWVCFTAANHTSGGNSGSPIIDADGNLLGLNFDRTWESTMSDLMYDPTICRNISVDARYVLFIIDKFAGASHLIKELSLVK